LAGTGKILLPGEKLSTPMTASINRTVQQLHASYLAPVTRQLAWGWRWWLTQLKELLPDNVRRVIAARNQRLILETDGNEFLVHHGSAGQMQEIGRIQRSADDATTFPLPTNVRQTILHLAVDNVLSRALTLPLAAEENLREVLSFEMDRQTPFSADQVYYDFVVIGRSTISKTLSLQLYLTPRDIIDDSIGALSANGIRPDVVAPNTKDNPGGHVINLLPADKRHNQGVNLHRLNLSLAVLALFLFITVLALPVLQKNRTIRWLEAQVGEATIAAQASIELRKDVEKLTAGSNYLVEKKLSEPTVMQLLDEMTLIIPDDAWVNRIDISDGEIQLHGQSDSAAGLIVLIEESAAFHNARFRSPVTQVARTNKERFNLSADAVRRSNQ
jgi:general secretion pathway protein L